MTASKDILKVLVHNSQTAIDDGIYDIDKVTSKNSDGFANRIKASAQKRVPIITEVKFASPSEGRITDFGDPKRIATQMIQGGATALSVLTQPHLFGGTPTNVTKIREITDIPILMKDVIIHNTQIEAAFKIGADCILLIQSLFDKGHLKDVKPYIDKAHSLGLDVILEVHTIPEYETAIKTTADIIGINNRNLDTLQVDTHTTCDILCNAKKYAQTPTRPIISESGISTPDQIIELHQCGATGFLVGSSIMKSSNMVQHVKKLVAAY